MQHRPGDEVGKVRDEQRVGNEPRLRGLALARVDEKGDLGEREERNSERQDDRCQGNVDPGELPQRFDEKVGVLEITERGEIGGDRERQHLLRGAGTTELAQATDRATQVEVDDDGREQQQEVLRIPVAVEEQRSQREPRRTGVQQAQAPEQVEPCQSQGKEAEEKFVRVE